MNHLGITFSYEPDGLVRLHLAGDLDMDSAGRLVTAVEDITADENTTAVLIDLTRLAFLDAAGITALLKIHHFAEEHRRPLRVANYHGLARRVLTIANVLSLFNGHDPVGGHQR